MHFQSVALIFGVRSLLGESCVHHLFAKCQVTSKYICEEVAVEVKDGKDFKSINELETGQQ